MTRRAVAIGLAAAAMVPSSIAAAVQPAPPTDSRPNIVVVVTDDQTFGSIPHDPPVMPYLQGQVEDPRGGWTVFRNAFVNTPLCCPSRATILTGRFSHRTGVEANDEGDDLDEASTLATWLHASGYRTGLVGKYLNDYPFDRGPYVPPGWDHFFAKQNTSDATVYRNYTVVDDGIVRGYGAAASDYATDVLARDALWFIRSTPPGRPFFLLFAPSASHRPWFPAARHDGAYAALSIAEPPSLGEADVSDKPAWVRRLAPLEEGARGAFRADRRREYETLLAVDESLHAIDEALRSRGELDDTVVVYLSDNGYALGEHRWETKSCPYEACTRVPFLVRVPGESASSDPRLVSNVDVAPTVAELAGVRPPMRLDGESLVGTLRGDGRTPERRGVLMEFVGGGGVPAWRAVRTRRFLWVELATGERELYDLAGVAGPADPAELDNRAGEAAYAAAERRLASLIPALRDR